MQNYIPTPTQLSDMPLRIVTFVLLPISILRFYLQPLRVQRSDAEAYRRIVLPRVREIRVYSDRLTHNGYRHIMEITKSVIVYANHCICSKARRQIYNSVRGCTCTMLLFAERKRERRDRTYAVEMNAVCPYSTYAMCILHK